LNFLFFISNLHSSGTNGFNGAIALLRFHDVALSQEELRRESGAVAAFAPFPADKATTAALDVPLGWKPGPLAAQSSVVYLGTDRSAVDKGDAALTVKGAANPTSPVKLRPGMRYFWRVEGRDAGGAVVSKGTIWSFTADPGLASGPTPRNEDGNVAVSGKTLAWIPARYGTGQRVVIATDRAAVEGGGSGGIEVAADKGMVELPAALKPGTRYFCHFAIKHG
jgi:hypothetical protein